MRVLALVKNDVRVQARQGFFAAYVLVCAAYVALLLAVPEEALGMVATVVVFSDPAALGFFFVGGLLLLERADGALQAVSVSPVRTWEFLAGRALSLTVLAVVASAVIVAIAVPGVHWPLLLAAVAVTSPFNILFGIAIAARSRTTNQYFAQATLWSAPLFAPVGLFFWVPDSPWLLLMPTTASLQLIAMSLGEVPFSAWAALGGLVSLSGYTAAMGLWARSWFERAVLEGRA